MDKEKLQNRVNTINKLTSQFCAKHIDDEYAEISKAVIGKLQRKRPSPMLRGKEEIWAAAIIHAIGSINFLYDKSFEPYVTLDEINDFFGTKKSSVGSKASEIKKMLNMGYFSSEFSTNKLKKSNPLLNTVMVDGFIVPLDSIPEKHQQEVRAARERGQDISFTTKQ